MKVRAALAALLVFGLMAVIGCEDTKTAQPKLKDPGDTRLVPASPGGPPGGGPAPAPAPKPD